MSRTKQQTQLERLATRQTTRILRQTYYRVECDCGYVMQTSDANYTEALDIRDSHRRSASHKRWAAQREAERLERRRALDYAGRRRRGEVKTEAPADD